MSSKNAPYFLCTARGSYFAADDGVHGIELWRVAPDGQVGMVADINPGGTGSDPQNLLEAPDGTIYFTASPDLGVYADRQFLFRLRPGSEQPEIAATKALQPALTLTPAMVATGGALYLKAASAVTPTSIAYWRFDPTINGFTEVKAIGDRAVLGVSDAIQSGGYLFFAGTDAPNPQSLYRLKDTDHCERVVGHLEQPNTPTFLTDMNGTLYFAAVSSGNGREVWRVSGGGSADRVTDIAPGSASASISAMYGFGNVALVELSSALYKIDPETGNLVLLDTCKNVRSLFLSGRFAYFIATGADGIGGLYKTDGTATGTQRLLQFGSIQHAFWAQEVGGEVYMLIGIILTNRFTSFELWKSEKTYTSATVVDTLAPYLASDFNFFSTQNLLGTDGRYIYFPKYSDGIGIEPYRLAIASAPAVGDLVISGNSTATTTTHVDQRSNIRSLTLTFDQQVAMDVGAVSLTGHHGAGSGTVVDVANPSADGRTWLITFSGSPVVDGSLADGVYDLIVSATKVHRVDVPAVAMANDYLFTFHRLFGDVNGDRTVGGIDYFQFAKAYGKSSADPLALEAFDYDANGTIGGLDYFQFAKRYGKPALSD